VQRSKHLDGLITQHLQHLLRALVDLVVPQQ
jgi:hypothetical protein